MVKILALTETRPIKYALHFQQPRYTRPRSGQKKDHICQRIVYWAAGVAGADVVALRLF